MPTGIDDKRLSHLEQLGQALTLWGFYAHVVHPDGGTPYLRVTNQAALQMTERVHCQHDGDGAWSYTWPWQVTIGPVDDLPGAVERVTRVLGTVTTR